MKNLPIEVLLNIIDLLKTVIYSLFGIGVVVFGFFAKAVIGKFDKLESLIVQMQSHREMLDNLKEEQKEHNIRLNQIEKNK